MKNKINKKEGLLRATLVLVSALLVFSCGQQSNIEQGIETINLNPVNEEIIVDETEPLPITNIDTWKESPQWGGRVGYIDTNNILWVQSTTRPDEPWFKIAENVAEFQLMDWTFSYRTHSGDLFLVSGALNSKATLVDSDVSAYQMLITGRMGYLKQDNSFYVREKGYEPQKVATNVHAFHLLGDKIGFTGKNGGFWMQHGGTAYGFEKLAENVVDFQIEGNWVALQKIDKSGETHLWTANSDSNSMDFTRQLSGVEKFQMQATFVAGGDEKPVLHLAVIDVSGSAKILTQKIDKETKVAQNSFMTLKQIEGVYNSVEWAGEQLALTTPNDGLKLAQLNVVANKVESVRDIGLVNSYDLVQEGYLTTQFSGEEQVSTVLVSNIKKITNLQQKSQSNSKIISISSQLGATKLLDSHNIKNAIHYQRSSGRPEFLRHAMVAEQQPVGRSIAGVGQSKSRLQLDEAQSISLVDSPLIYSLASKNHQSSEKLTTNTNQKAASTRWAPIMVNGYPVMVSLFKTFDSFPNVKFPKGMTPYADNYIRNYVATHAQNEKQKITYKITNPRCSGMDISHITSTCWPEMEIVKFVGNRHSCPSGPMFGHALNLYPTSYIAHPRPALREERTNRLWEPVTKIREGRSGYKTDYDSSHRIYTHRLNINYYLKIADPKGWVVNSADRGTKYCGEDNLHIERTLNGRKARNVMWGEVTPDGYGMVPMKSIGSIPNFSIPLWPGQYNLPGPKGAPRKWNDGSMKTGDIVQVNLPREVFVATLGDRLFGGGDGPQCPKYSTCSTISSRAKAVDDNNDGIWDRVVLTGYFSADDVWQNTKDVLADIAMLTGLGNAPNPNVLAVKKWHTARIERGQIANTFRVEGHSLGAADATVLHHWGVGNELVTYALPAVIPAKAGKARSGTTAKHYLSPYDPVAVGPASLSTRHASARNRFKSLTNSGAKVIECSTSILDLKVHNRDLYQKCFTRDTSKHY